MLTQTDVWDELDEWARTTSPSKNLLTEANLTEMLAELHEIDNDFYLKLYVRAWLEKGGLL